MKSNLNSKQLRFHGVRPTVHATLTKGPRGKLKLVQQIQKQALRAYYYNVYTVANMQYILRRLC